MTRYAEIEKALIELAATHAWQTFGECRAYDRLGKSGPFLTAAEADALARAALSLPAQANEEDSKTVKDGE